MRRVQGPRRRGIGLLGTRVDRHGRSVYVFHPSAEALEALPESLRREHTGSPWCLEVSEEILVTAEPWSAPLRLRVEAARRSRFEIRGLHRTLVLDRSRPVVVGIVNATPDSFSDGGLHRDPQRAIDHALTMIRGGTPWIDVGGESTRPGAPEVSAEEEVDRVLPILEGLRRATDVWISIDTTKRAVAEAAIAAGADLVNDVSGGRGDPELLPWLAERSVPCVLNHMRGTPRTMQVAPQYASAVEEVHDELEDARDAGVAAGIDAARIVLDPGIGFGKRLADNLELLRHVDELNDLGHPVLVGASRKRFLGTLLDREDPAERDAGTCAVTAFLVPRRVCAVRVHDARAAGDVIAVTRALEEPSALEHG